MINKKYNISFKYIKNTLRMIKMHKHTIIYSRMSKDYTTHKCSLCNVSAKCKSTISYSINHNFCNKCINRAMQK